LFFAADSVVTSYSELNSMRQLRAMVELAETGDPLTETLQKERGRSAVFLASKPGTDDARQAGTNLAEQRRQTDARIDDYQLGIEALMARVSFDSAVETSIREVRQGLAKLDTLRNSIDNRSLAPGDSASRYTAMIMELVNRIALIIRRSTDPELTRDVNAYYALAELAERAGRERAVGASLIRSGNFDLPTLRKIAGLEGQQDAYFNEALAMLNANESLRTILEEQPAGAASQSLEQKRETLFSSPSGMYALDASDWFATTTQRIGELNNVRKGMLAEVLALATAGVKDARNDLIMVSAISAGAVLAVLVLMLVIIRAINLQVGRLLEGVRFAMDNKD
ncbi:MAG: nitrate- and nitrite sensing domain-containing protein, partial [Marinobacter sp.]|nr:nitrate- and nitrite sensing domain-containing protein [Marinobacter sp.]